MKRKLLIAIIVIMMSTMLSGCLSDEQKAEGKRYEKQAEKNAVVYIKEKYGIDAEVTGSSYNVTGMFGDAVSSYVDVEMKYDGKKFGVYIIGSKPWEDIEEPYKSYTSDNYQYDIIYKDIMAYLKEKTKVNIKELSVWYNDNAAESTRLEHLTNQYYDGNVEAFFAEQYVSAVIVTTDKEIGDFSDVDMHDGSLYAYSYEEEYYEKNGHTVENYNEYMCTLWMNWSADLSYGKKEVTAYEKQKFELGYLVHPKECEVKVNDTSVDIDGWKKSGFDKAKKVSDAYKITGDEENIYIFVKSDNDDEFIGIAYEKNGKIRYGKLKNNQGEYLVGVLEMKDYKGKVDVVILED